MLVLPLSHKEIKKKKSRVQHLVNGLLKKRAVEHRPVISNRFSQGDALPVIDDKLARAETGWHPAAPNP